MSALRPGEGPTGPAPGALLFRRAWIHAPEVAPADHDSVAVVGDTIVAVGPEAECRAELDRRGFEVPGASGTTAGPGPAGGPDPSGRSGDGDGSTARSRALLSQRSAPAVGAGSRPVSDAVEVVDLDGRALVPGFIDAHVHPMVMSVFESHLSFEGATSVVDVLDAVRDAARADGAANGDRAVLGFQLDDQVLAERRLPTAAELESASPGRPVVLIRRDGHHAVASTTALVAAGLAGDSSRVARMTDGYVATDEHGLPTGLVGEGAVARVLALAPEIDMDLLASGADRWAERLLSQGVTAISAICQTSAEGPSGPAGEMEAVGWSALVDRLPFDIQTILVESDPAVVSEFRAVTSLHDPAAGRRVDAVKLFLDGTLGGASACMHHPFADRADTAGMRTLPDDEAYRRMVAAHLAGLQICVHAIGDRANRDAADLFDRLLAEHPGAHRHRVEHASVLDDETVESFARNGIACVVQPVSLRSEAHWLAARLGPDRLARAYPFRRLLDHGVTVAGSSDAPIETTDVVAAMDAAVDRRGLADEQAVTATEALAMYTTGASRARSTEGRIGRIGAGARADLVVLPTAPYRCLPGRPEVLATFVAGVERHRHESFPAPAPARP